MARDTDVRTWLRENGFDSIADEIDAVLDEWKHQKKKTRRNWWEVLAGGANGRPRTVAGRPFPVLRAAQIRQGKAVTENAVGPDDGPDVWSTGRWPAMIDSDADTAAKN